MQIEPNKFKEWLEMYYTSPNTRKQYAGEEVRFIERFVGDEKELHQTIINRYIQQYRHKNPMYMGFLRAYIDCYDPEGMNNLKIPKDRSRRLNTSQKEYKFIEKIDLDTKLEVLKQNSYQAWLMARIYFETGLRATELINLNNENKDWGWNLNECYMYGIGKGNKTFKVHFSPKTAELVTQWIAFKCKDKDRPFVFFKSNGVEYKNSYDKLIRTFKRYCDFTPHQLRHALGHHLRVEQGWDMEQIRKKLRHSKIDTTQIYVVASDKEIQEKEKEMWD